MHKIQICSFRFNTAVNTDGCLLWGGSLIGGRKGIGQENPAVSSQQQQQQLAAWVCSALTCRGGARPLLALGSVGVYPVTAETLVEPLGASLLQWTLHVSPYRLQLLRQMQPFITTVGGGRLWVLVTVIHIIFRCFCSGALFCPGPSMNHFGTFE